MSELRQAMLLVHVSEDGGGGASHLAPPGGVVGGDHQDRDNVTAPGDSWGRGGYPQFPGYILHPTGNCPHVVREEV